MTKCFVDKNHDIMNEYYDFMDSGEESTSKVEQKMREFIKKDPLFLDPYIMIYNIYLEANEVEQADSILNEAYEAAIKTITDKKGEWPDELEWGFLENRHIIRTLLNKAISHWHKEENDKALSLLRKLLKSNPHDNIGARNFILAILLDMKYGDFENKMMSKNGYGYDGKKLMEFEEKMKDFPEEFDWWFKVMEE